MNHRANWLRGILPVLLAALLSGCKPSQPPLDFLPLDGPGSALQEHAGKWLFINYWAEWCKPCLEEIPELNAFHRKHSGTRAEVFGLNYDNLQDDALRRISGKLDIRFPVLRSPPDRILAGQRPEVMPTTYVIGPDGRLHGTLLGPQSQADLEQVISAVPDAAGS